MENILMDANGNVYEVNGNTPCVDMPSDELECERRLVTGSNAKYLTLGNIDKLPKSIIGVCYYHGSTYTGVVIDFKVDCKNNTIQFRRASYPENENTATSVKSMGYNSARKEYRIELNSDIFFRDYIIYIIY